MATPMDELDFDGKTVIVTGGCRGVGRGIAERFGEAGANVVVCCRHEPETLPGNAAFVAADVRDADEIDKVVEFTLTRFGGIDVLVNNAGGSPPAETATASPKFSRAIIDLNLVAPLLFAQRVFDVMRAQPDGGSIVNIASVSGVRPSPTTA